MLKFNKIFIFLAALFSLSGCSKVVLNSDVDPNVELTGLKTFYVQKLPADNRGIEKKIADKLNSLGYSASSGISNKPEQPVDAIVTYTDRWMWDITMYMLELNVYFRSPENEYIFASGNSYRTSLVRKNPEYMIEEVLRKMLSLDPMPKEENGN